MVLIILPAKSVTGERRKQIANAVPGLSDQEIDLRTLAYWSAVYGFA